VVAIAALASFAWRRATGFSIRPAPAQ